MARHEPHMCAAMGPLQQARAELEKAAPNKGGHRERAMQLVDQAMQQVQRRRTVLPTASVLGRHWYELLELPAAD